MNEEQQAERLAQAMKIIEAVATMRNLQTAYFKNRIYGDLQRSKQYERMVDQMIEQFKKPAAKAKAPEMFA